MRSLIIRILLMTVFSVPVIAQNFLVHHYTEPDGLPSSEVRGILQDRQGRMWFATRAGVGVYDGIDWKRFTMKDGLPWNPIIKIDIDNKERIWAMSENAKEKSPISYYKDGRWYCPDNLTRPPGFTAGLVNCFGIVDVDNHQFPYIAIATQDNGLLLWEDSRWRRIDTTNGLPGNTVYGLAVSKQKIYLATVNGLAVLHPGPGGRMVADKRLMEKLKLPGTAVRGITVEFAGKYSDSRLKYSRIWLAGDNWLGYIAENQEKGTFFPLEGIRFKEPRNHLYIQPDYRGGIYIGSPYRVYYYNLITRTMRYIGVENGLISEGTYAFAIDFEKNIWIACHRGVSKISSRRFTNFRLRHGLLEDEVSSILHYKPGTFLLGHNNGVTFYHPATQGTPPVFQKVRFPGAGEPGTPLCRVLDMTHDHQGNIWVAASRTGLIKIDAQKRLTMYDERHGLPDYVVCLWYAENGVLWVGTEKGIYRRYQDRFEHRPMGRFNAPSVRRIYGSNGKLRYLAGTQTGLYIYDENRDDWKNIRVRQGNGRANAIYAVQKWRGQLFAGTGTGLYVMSSGGQKLEPYNHNGFQIQRPVYAIIKDARERLWLGTDNGVILWDGFSSKTFTTTDGLVGQEINRTAVLLDKNGRLWFGTNNGLSIYNEIFDNSRVFNPAPRLKLLYAEAGNKNLLLDKPLRLDYHDNTLVFHFRGISFIDEKAIRFKSKLEGFDENWSHEQYPYKQMIRYTNLSPGTYRFHLKAKSAEGVWTPKTASADIIILRPFYRSWWFYTLVTLLILAIFYAVSRFIYQKRYAALLERKVEERGARLHLIEKRYRHLFEESGDTVFITTHDGQFVDVNPAGVELFGFDSKEDLLSLKSTKSLYDDLGERKAYLQTIEQEGQVRDYELVFKKKSDERIITRVTASLVRDNDGKIAGYRGIIRDITRQKRLEEQLMQAHKMEAIGTLAGGIAHDFNNILGVIIGYTELALDDLEEGSLLQNNIRQVMTAAERASGLVKQILAFSRQSERKRKPMKLDIIVKEVMKLLRSTLPATIEIRQGIQPDAGMVMADATQMHQVIMNLCANSAHAMKESGGVLDISLRSEEVNEAAASRFDDLRPGHYLRLTVADSGHGIPQVVLKRVFEPYFTTKKAGEGTGMGLAVVHGIIKSHGGDISVYSEPGEGTTFHVMLPRLEAGAEGQKTDTAELSVRGDESLLMVDDEPSLIQAGTQMMTRLGYSVAGFTDPRDALDAVKEDPQRFDLVVTDLTMPHMTGLQLAREIKNLIPGMPIILSSGFSTLATRNKIKAYGINDFVMKPIVRNELALVVRKLLDKKSNN